MRLGEADANIRDEVPPTDTGSLSCHHSRVQLGSSLRDDVLIRRKLLHRLWRPAHVHQHGGHPQASDGRQHLGIVGAAADVIDHGGPTRDELFRDLRVECIHRDGQVQPPLPQPSDDGRRALELLLGGNWLSARAGRLRSHVDQVGARLLHGQPSTNGVLECLALSAVAEGVWRGVDHSRQPRAAAPPPHAAAHRRDAREPLAA
mmetsp:Transcript_35989/g.89572  ORF Transcript_35989/g.89572 Transcript_35989/m.89572 type:complete len:204 (-) Transcript_35989:486-1097(-)